MIPRHPTRERGGRELGHLTWTQLDASVRESTAVLPIGALKPHGPHLPLATDSILAEYFARELADQVSGLLLPTLSYGYRTNPQRMGGHFTGLFDVSAATLTSHVRELLTACYREGFRSINIVQAAYTNTPFVLDAVEQFVDSAPDALVVMGAWWDYTPESLRNDIARETGTPRSEDHHAAMAETSLMMHARPDLVRVDRLRSSPPHTERLRYTVVPMPPSLQTDDGVVYRNEHASADIGRRIAQAAVENMVTAARTHTAPRP